MTRDGRLGGANVRRVTLMNTRDVESLEAIIGDGEEWPDFLFRKHTPLYRHLPFHNYVYERFSPDGHNWNAGLVSSHVLGGYPRLFLTRLRRTGRCRLVTRTLAVTCTGDDTTSSDAGDGKEGPLSGQAFEDVTAAVLEADAGACDEVFDGVRDQDFAWDGGGGDTGADVNRDAADLFADDFALARVQAAPDFEPERAQLVVNPARAADGAGWPVEGGEEPVARAVDLPPPEPRELAPCHGARRFSLTASSSHATIRLRVGHSSSERGRMIGTSTTRVMRPGRGVITMTRSPRN